MCIKLKSARVKLNSVSGKNYTTMVHGFFCAIYIILAGKERTFVTKIINSVLIFECVAQTRVGATLVQHNITLIVWTIAVCFILSKSVIEV